MTDQDNTYRPRSPDLSTLQSPIPPAVTSPVYPLASPLGHRASYDASPFFTPQYQQPAIPHQQYIPPFADPHYPQSFDMARRSSRLARAAEVAPLQMPMAMPVPVPETKYIEPVVPEEPPQPTPAAGIEVKTKFPVARIKRIMQADEDVGKVAQVTPIAVSKALELFMISLVTKAAKEARDRNSKRVTASHLKQAVVKDEVLDFLADIIAKVPDQPAGGRKHEDDGSDQNEQPKRKRGGRRPKDDSD
ncbi:negative cofactor 2 transcription regulator complex subunit BUR6 [Aspergillus clavatus NRRL 1]|uniref:NCT transcriptional regulatory complex subunit A n=1 Tax=Aspergillus clavatus (strain ATCC 1007 / CBS 513.65 / DSM 816 / NCTC 3887 / NRRL 1 / QM 1276 / 107) TaxID=344612 RepID=A1C7C9_ASPCL|nr:histone-like transcription factor (CBF/NF-Y), putative [Aspergillus clavatus NRRL 1]EAW14300.1 histone-like transcription factor (CBF/NF-Y), putative [Aspergillus clavatus NRRL 1]